MKKFFAMLFIVMISALCLSVLTACEPAQNVVNDAAYITKAEINDDGYLVLTFSDGNELMAGKVKGEDGKDGANGSDGTNGSNGADGVSVTSAEINADGDLIITLSNGQSFNVGKIKENETDEGTDGLTYYPLPDGTYAVSAGVTQYLDTITIPATHNGKAVSQIAAKAFKNADNLTTITIPDSVTSIGDEAFQNCRNLTIVIIGNGVTSIGDDAFSECRSLTSVTIPDSVTSIGNSAFWNCSSLTSVTIPDSVTSIGNNAFRDCSSLTSVTIPDSVTSIGEWAFYYCSSLTSVTIGNGVTSIGNSAFRDCSSLTSITFKGTKAQWQAISKGNNWKNSVPSSCVVRCNDGDLNISEA